MFGLVCPGACQKRKATAKPTPESIAAAAEKAAAAAKAEEERVAAAEEHKQRGTAHFKKKEYGKAVAQYTEALRKNPNEASVWANRSIAHRQLSLWAEAAEDGERAVALDPKNAKAHYSHAVALQKLGRGADALAACRAGLAEHEDHEPMTELQKELLAADLSAAPLKETKKPKPEQEGGLGLKPQDKPKAPKEAKPEAPSATSSASEDKAKKKPADYSVNYSKWKDLADSDDEKEEKKNNIGPELLDLGEGETVQVIIPGKDGKRRIAKDEERMYIVDQLMDVARLNLQKNKKTLAGGMEDSGLPGTSTGPMKAAKGVKLPVDHMRSMGVIGLPQLAKFSCSNPRMLVSVYGDIFDVSTQPELYGNGPHSFHSGADITWGLVTGTVKPNNLNQFYDIFKIGAEVELRRNLQIVCHYLVSYREQFGQPVGRLDNWIDESLLPMPPLDSGGPESCPQQ